MNHKRKGPKSTRAGCLFCKYWKGQGTKAMTTHQTVQERRSRVAAAVAVFEWSSEHNYDWLFREQASRLIALREKWRRERLEVERRVSVPAFGVMAHAFTQARR